MKRMEIIMSYVITNGEYYIKYLHRAQITKDIEESYKFETIDLAKEILQAAPNILKDYYVYNLKTQRKCWRIMTEEELEELRARKKIKRTKSGKIKRKTYSPDVRKLLYIKADGKCELCGKKILLDDMTIDHVKPLSMGEKMMFLILLVYAFHVMCLREIYCQRTLLIESTTFFYIKQKRKLSIH